MAISRYAQYEELWRAWDLAQWSPFWDTTKPWWMFSSIRWRPWHRAKVGVMVWCEWGNLQHEIYLHGVLQLMTDGNWTLYGMSSLESACIVQHWHKTAPIYWMILFFVSFLWLVIMTAAKLQFRIPSLTAADPRTHIIGKKDALHPLLYCCRTSNCCGKKDSKKICRMCFCWPIFGRFCQLFFPFGK